MRLVQTLFDARALQEEIGRVVGDLRLDSDALCTSVAIITKRLDTGGTWIVTNNPQARYWDDPADRSYVGNRHYRLADLLRASTAAPYYFTPHQVRIVEDEAPGLFIDGGMTPHNNPALALLQIAAIPAYGFSWPVGADALRIISIGTGLYRPRLSAAAARRLPAAVLAIEALRGMSADSSELATTMMELLGRTRTPWPVNSEIGLLGGFNLAAEPLFSFERFNVRLEQDWLKQELGMNFSEKAVTLLTQLDNSADLRPMYEIGQAAAEKFVRPEHLGLA